MKFIETYDGIVEADTIESIRWREEDDQFHVHLHSLTGSDYCFATLDKSFTPESRDLFCAILCNTLCTEYQGVLIRDKVTANIHEVLRSGNGNNELPGAEPEQLQQDSSDV